MEYRYLAPNGIMQLWTCVITLDNGRVFKGYGAHKVTSTDRAETEMRKYEQRETYIAGSTEDNADIDKKQSGQTQ